MIKKFELTIVHRIVPDRGMVEVKSVNKIEADDLIELLGQFPVLVASLIREVKEIESTSKYDDEIPFEVTPIEGVILTKEEAKIFTNCPFSDIAASEKNYPGYNDVVSKIMKFARS